jgi:hypothetical protein
MRHLHASYRARLLALVASGGALIGCSSDGPPPTLTAVTPDHVCGGIDVTLTLTGDHFAARLRDVLGQPVGETPAVAATLVATLAGQPATAAPATLASRWQSVEQLSVDVAADALPSGLYDIAVTNLDGARASLPRALTRDVAPQVTLALGPPDPARVCVAARAQTITVPGSGILRVGSAVPTVSIVDSAGNLTSASVVAVSNCSPQGVPPGAQACTTLMVSVPAGIPATGMAALIVENPPLPGGGCANAGSRMRVPLVLTSGPSVTAAAPMVLCGTGTDFVVTGDGFAPGATVSLVDPTTGTALAAGAVTVASPTQLTASFGANGYADNTRLDLVVVNPDGCAGTGSDLVKRKNGTGNCP